MPEIEKCVRITDHCSLFKMFKENDEFNFISLSQVDTKVRIKIIFIIIINILDANYTCNVYCNFTWKL